MNASGRQPWRRRRLMGENIRYRRLEMVACKGRVERRNESGCWDGWMGENSPICWLPSSSVEEGMRSFAGDHRGVEWSKAGDREVFKIICSENKDRVG